MSTFGIVSDSGVNPEVEKRWVTISGAEGSEVSSLGKVGGGVGERSAVDAGITVASGVDKTRPGVVKAGSERIREVRSRLGGKVSGGSEVTFRVEAASGMSHGAESEVTEVTGEAEGAGEGAGGARDAVGRCSRRSGHSFLSEPEGGKTDGRGQPAPPTPGARHAPPGRPTNEKAQGLVTSWVAGRLHPTPAPHLPTSPPPATSPGATWCPPLRVRDARDRATSGGRRRQKGGGQRDGGGTGRETREWGGCVGLPRGCRRG